MKKVAKEERLTIGELSRRTGLPVKTLRFWSDEGLIPPATRSQSGYRIYGEKELVRLDLVRTLRDAGMPLDTIRKVLRHDLSLADALHLQLGAVEAHVASLQRVAAALRAALRGEPNESDVRRLCAVTKLTNDERKAVIERFHERVAEGMQVDEAWRKKMLAGGIPELPDDASPAQLDAWIELSELVADPTFVESLRKSAKQIAERNIDMNGLRLANEGVAAGASAARAKGLAPSSAEGGAVVRAYVEAVARASGKTSADEAFVRHFCERFAKHDPRASRYRELLAIVNGETSVTGTTEDWRFVSEAVRHHLG